MIIYCIVRAGGHISFPTTQNISLACLFLLIFNLEENNPQSATDLIQWIMTDTASGPV